MLEMIMFGLGSWMGYYVGKTGKLPEYVRTLIDKIFKK